MNHKKKIINLTNKFIINLKGNKIIIDKDSGSGVVPYLPLQELKSGAN